MLLENLRGQVYDGASNMNGAYNGAQAIILREQPLVYYTLCMFHLTNLVAFCISVLPDVRDVLSHVNELGKIANNSIKFRNVLKLSLRQM